jgi:hypothetical protein
VSIDVRSARQDYAQDWRGFSGRERVSDAQGLHFPPKTTLDTPSYPSLCRLRSPCHAKVSRPRNNVSINSASRSESEGDGAKGHVPSCASTLRRASRSALSAYPSECGDWGQSWSCNKTNHRDSPDRLQISHATGLLVLLVGHERGRGGFVVHRFGQHLVKWRHPCTSPDPRLSNIPVFTKPSCHPIGSFHSYIILLNGSLSNLLDV